ncbi:Os11g0580500 [Oryza sativa Japonica Group]|uniref:Os11g0580500 protein n=1 Tax=Oryza sativa subsp. japonica TaxID=39947 RepID=A0A0N7KT46_ORYSJ|nr:Os11g0580500 [Oryza sativa Japonica Group]
MPKRRRRRGRGVAPPPDPSPATIDYYCSLKEIAASGAPGAEDFVRNHGLHLLLFETPSGFAIFSLCGAEIHIPDALEIIWLKEFQKFDDNSNAINVGTGVNKQLTDMIMQWRRPGQKLVVGKPEYKSTIETFLGIPCLHDEVVMEVMWGMKRFMSNFVPAEESNLPKEDSLPMSQGLLMFLSRYGFDVKPEMVNEDIVRAAATLFHCDIIEKKCCRALLDVGHYLKRESGIDYENWDTLKLATAFKIICSRKIGDSDEMFSDDVQSKLPDDADKYKDLVYARDCLRLYENLVAAYNVRAVKKDELALLVKRANADEAEQARSITTII